MWYTPSSSFTLEGKQICSDFLMYGTFLSTKIRKQPPSHMHYPQAMYSFGTMHDCNVATTVVLNAGHALQFYHNNEKFNMMYYVTENKNYYLTVFLSFFISRKLYSFCNIQQSGPTLISANRLIPRPYKNALIVFYLRCWKLCFVRELRDSLHRCKSKTSHNCHVIYRMLEQQVQPLKRLQSSRRWQKHDNMHFFGYLANHERQLHGKNSFTD